MNKTIELRITPVGLCDKKNNELFDLTVDGKLWSTHINREELNSEIINLSYGFDHVIKIVETDDTYDGINYYADLYIDNHLIGKHKTEDYIQAAIDIVNEYGGI